MSECFFLNAASAADALRHAELPADWPCEEIKPGRFRVPYEHRGWHATHWRIAQGFLAMHHLPPLGQG
jgi:hypothetical protein